MERHSKVWGEELIIVNTPLYCGKKLILKRGKKTSLHYHMKKDETFYVHSGIVLMRLYPEGFPGKVWHIITLVAGDSVHIRPGLIHQSYGIRDSEIFEFSTQHFEEDTVRLEAGN